MEDGDVSRIDGDQIKRQPRIPARYVLSILSFLGFCNLYALRVNLSVAIVAMVNDTSSTDNSGGVECQAGKISNSTSKAQGEFHWNSDVQGLVLGSFFYGYICTQVLGGWISHRFGAKRPFGLSCVLAGLLALFIPLAAKTNYKALVALRILQGLCQVGTFGAMIISGVLSEHLGWESVFYFFGATSCLWFVFWVFFAFDSPDSHPRITEDERLYIRRAIGSRCDSNEQPFPWRQALTSLPVWALCIANFGHNWGFYTLLTNIPSYLSKVLHFSLQENGSISALPYIVMAIMMQVSGVTADWLRQRRIMSTTAVRRMFHFLGQMLPAICLVFMGTAGCNVYAAVALLTLAVGTDGIASAGFQVNHVDISPTHAGILMGVTNTFGTIPGFLGPYVVGLLTPDSLLSEWRSVFYISAGIYVANACIFGVCASGKPAKWEIKPDDADEPLLE